MPERRFCIQALAFRRASTRRVILVDVPVSSRKTSRCGSCRMRGWRLVRQCSRAWRTSERSCSLARSVFFEAVAVADEPARDRGGRDLGAQGRQFGRELRHGDVVLLSHAADQEAHDADRAWSSANRPPAWAPGCRWPDMPPSAGPRRRPKPQSGERPHDRNDPPRQSAPHGGADPASRTWSERRDILACLSFMMVICAWRRCGAVLIV